MLVRPKVFSRKKKRKVGSLKKYKGIGEKKQAPTFCGRARNVGLDVLKTVLTELTAVFLLIRVGIAKKKPGPKFDFAKTVSCENRVRKKNAQNPRKGN